MMIMMMIIVAHCMFWCYCLLTFADVWQHCSAEVPEGHSQWVNCDGNVFEWGWDHGVQEPCHCRWPRRRLDDQCPQWNATYQQTHHQGSCLLLLWKWTDKVSLNHVQPKSSSFDNVLHSHQPTFVPIEFQRFEKFAYYMFMVIHTLSALVRGSGSSSSL